MVSVDHKIVGRLLHFAIFLHIGTAIVGICLVKAVLQIEVRLIHRLHYGIVDVSICNADPAHQITVLLIKPGKLRQEHLFLIVWNLLHRFHSGIRLRRSVYKFSQLAIKLRLLICFLVVVDHKIGACAENGYKHHNKNCTDFLSHRIFFPKSKMPACFQASISRFCRLIFRA